MLDLKNRIEAIVFLSKEPVTIEDLAEYFKLERERVESAVYELKEDKKNAGVNLKIENRVMTFVTNPNCGEEIKNFFNPGLKIKKLSKSTMETLAIIAYKGPITKGEIELIRGVSAEKALVNLLEKKLIYISGKKKAIGTPNLYEVTEDFFSYLNIENNEKLPGYEKFREIEFLVKPLALASPVNFAESEISEKSDELLRSGEFMPESENSSPETAKEEKEAGIFELSDGAGISKLSEITDSKANLHGEEKYIISGNQERKVKSEDTNTAKTVAAEIMEDKAGTVGRSKVEANNSEKEED